MNFGEGERSDDQYTCDKEDQEQEELQDQVEEDEEEVMMTSSKLPFSPSSSSSSSKYKNLLSQHQHHHHQQQHHHQNLWLGSFDSSSSSLDTSKELPPPNFDSKKMDLMDFSLATNNSSNEPDTTTTTATTTTAGGAGGSSGGGGADSMEREHMFDKVVTPSDVGKLNRLVIPKQHAEKYFPLDSSSTEKGLLLNFEDRNGKSWRFRYSYWNSSQSYVMTKGWSRFVKEKKLDAGDIVSFQRGVGDAGKHRLYIDWRRRPNAPDPTAFTHLELQNQLHFSHPVRWGRLYSLPQSISSSLPPPRQFMEQQQPPPHPQFQNLNYMQPYHHQHQHHPITSYGNAAHQYYMRPPAASHPHQMGGGGGGVDYPYQHQHHHNYNQNQYHHQQQQFHQQQQPQQHHVPMVIDSVPVVHGKTVGKRLRLFGVNMECPTTQDDQSSSSTVQMHPPHHHHHHPHHLPPSSLQSRQQQQHSAASSMPAAAMQAELSKKGKSSSSLSFDLDL